MSIAGRTVATAFALLVGAGASQAPEFAQQYRQRLGGAVDELARVVARFDADAAAEGLARNDALRRYEGAADDFLNRRGASVRSDIARLDRLRNHAATLEAAPPTMRPILIAREGDGTIARATFRIYEPALPLTASGATYGLSGLFAAFLAWRAAASAARGLFGGKRRSKVQRTAERVEPAAPATLPPNPHPVLSGPIVPPVEPDRRARRATLVRGGRMGRMERSL